MMNDRDSPRIASCNGMVSPWLCEPMFESYPSFNFTEHQGDDNRKTQRTMGSPQALIQRSTSNPASGPSCITEYYHITDSSTQFSQSPKAFGQTTNLAEFLQNGATEPGCFEGAYSASNPQQQIIQSRGGSVSQQFGQIIPPGDVISGPWTAEGEKESAAAQAIERAKIGRSERARNAANQRHAKTKKMRLDSRQNSKAVSGSAERNIGFRMGKYREKNRLAAAKCRVKKKDNIGEIEEKHRNLSTTNSILREQIHELRGELVSLRMHALNHQDCNYQIARYNVSQAKRVALSVNAQSAHLRCGGTALAT